jgi:CspA family cold shock protein
MKQVTGRVVNWNDSKGYGFLEANGEKYFTHYTQIQGDGFKTLSEGQEVIFELGPIIGRIEAINVRKI